MQNFIRLLVLTLALLPPLVFSQTKISSADLLADFAIAEQAMLELHPGLFKYADSAAVLGHFAQTKSELHRDLTQGEAFLAFAKLAAGIRCGHTLANPFNQPQRVKSELFERADKVPFTFQLVGDRMLVDMDLTAEKSIGEGVEITAIGGVSVPDILVKLLPYVSADGSNDAQRRYDLQLTGLGEYETFDVLFPLVFPPTDGQFELSVFDFSKNENRSVRVPATDRSARFATMQERYGPLPATYDDLWEHRILDGRVGYLRLGTFVTYKMGLDWKKFIADAFHSFEEAGVANVVIDLRGNAGGMDDVSRELGKYLLQRSIHLLSDRTLVRYRSVPDGLRPYLGTWDQSFFDLKSKMKPFGQGFLTPIKESLEPEVVKPTGKRYPAKYWLLVDAANSSATFLIAKLLQENGVATLVGAPTGGNYRGINGGGMFFMTLPHSQVEIDIPIFGNYPLSEQPDRGVHPDILVQPTVEDVVQGRDVMLERVMAEISVGSR